MSNMTKRLLGWACAVAAVLMIPAIGRFPWTAGDYIFAGTVLFGAATLYELVTKNVPNATHRLMVGAAVGFVVMLIWAWAVA